MREARPDVVTSHFVHIPWPEPDYWHALPPELRVAVHEGLLANDVVGFHTERWRRSFLASCEVLLGALWTTSRERSSTAAARTRVVARPIGVDPAEFDAVRDDARRARAGAALVARRPEQLVLRVDRTDPSKNIVRGFRAFALLLERHPELHGRVEMLALLAPSRQDIAGVRGVRRAVERVRRAT